MAMPLPWLEKRSATMRIPGLYTPTRPTPASTRSITAVTRLSANSGNSMWDTTDMDAKETRMTLEPNLSVSGSTKRADTAKPSR